MLQDFLHLNVHISWLAKLCFYQLDTGLHTNVGNLREQDKEWLWEWLVNWKQIVFDRNNLSICLNYYEHRVIHVIDHILTIDTRENGGHVLLPNIVFAEYVKNQSEYGKQILIINIVLAGHWFSGNGSWKYICILKKSTSILLTK